MFQPRGSRTRENLTPGERASIASGASVAASSGCGDTAGFLLFRVTSFLPSLARLGSGGGRVACDGDAAWICDLTIPTNVNNQGARDEHFCTASRFGDRYWIRTDWMLRRDSDTDGFDRFTSCSRRNQNEFRDKRLGQLEASAVDLRGDLRWSAYTVYERFAQVRQLPGAE